MAGVSSFGMGGANCHLILAEGPPSYPEPDPTPAREDAVSCRALGGERPHQSALRAQADRLSSFVAGSAEPPPARPVCTPRQRPPSPPQRPRSRPTSTPSSSTGPAARTARQTPVPPPGRPPWLPTTTASHTPTAPPPPTAHRCPGTGPARTATRPGR
ncbi:polyketide synthase (plasmid) [Streptomyces clavuligerus]|uniref:Polyketide synthase n=1 Tax=Streptomyces clavuligerus TaxID=1901 RepID=D5SIT1_STRCL|nr:Polyketide synthase [Streptomyces clavuligerus]QPJ98160.1 polyketide synthase [Streptomyces clavuligerus]WDN56501.1 polyketide synthase [Streptomyces clavuligerus]